MPISKTLHISALLLAAGFMSTANANVPVLSTDVEAKHLYIMPAYGSGTIKQDFSNGTLTAEEKINLKIAGLKLLFSAPQLGNATPLFSLDTVTIDLEGEEVTTNYNMTAGAAIKTGNKQHIFTASYDSNEGDIQDSIELSAILRATDLSQLSKGLEFQFDASLKEGTESVSGGHKFSAGVNGKTALNTQTFLTGTLDVSTQSNQDSADGSHNESSPELSAEVGLAYQVLNNMQLTGSMFASYQTHKYFDANDNYLAQNVQTLTGISLGLTIEI